MAKQKDGLLNRRSLLKVLSLGATGCGGGSSGGTSPVPSNPEAATLASTVVPRPTPTEGKYRFQKLRLFQRAHAKTDPFIYTNSRGEVVHSAYHDVHYDLIEGSENCHRQVGASGTLICSVSRWPWKNAKGDYMDAKGQKQGSIPFATVAVYASAAPGRITLDVSSAFRYIHTNASWAALLLKVTGAGTLRMVGVLHPTAPKSTVDLVYGDGTNEKLALWYTSSTLTTTAYLNAHEDVIPVSPGVNGFIEFDQAQGRNKELKSAALHIEHQGTGNLTLSVFVISPELPDLTPVKGIAAAYPLDAGLRHDPNIILSQLVTDQTKIEDVLDTHNSGSYNTPYVPGVSPLTQRQEAFFDPTLWGQPALTAAITATKLPHRNLGKWVGSAWPKNSKGLPTFTVVHSNYAQHGFVPLASGLGAIHLTMPKRDIPNGQTWRVDGEVGTDVDLWLPYDKIGRVRRIRFRYYLLLGDGWEPRDDAMAFHFLGNQTGKWPEQIGLTTLDSLKTLKARPSDNTGKMFGGAQHLTSRVFVKDYVHPTRLNARGDPDDSQVTRAYSGGYGASSGGDVGYQGRMMWSGGFYKRLGGPAEGGLTLGMELYDMQNQRMPPSQYGIRSWDNGPKSSFSHNGGLGHVYKDGLWRCFEFEWLLNPNAPYVLPPRGTNFNESGFQQPPVGYLKTWVDGVLASVTPNFGFTRLPKIDWQLQADNGAPFDSDPASPAYMRPITNVTDEQYLGFASLAGNLYYGGRSPCPVERHLFLNGIAAAMDDAYIGPMAGVKREHGGLG